MVHRERELHARDAAPDHAGISPARREEGGPAVGERPERLGGDGMGAEARQIRHRRGDADIDGDDIVGQGGPPLQSNLPRGAVEPGGALAHEPGAGEARQAHEVDLELGARVVPCDVAGQHAGVGGARVRVDQREPRAGQRVHRPAAQDERVGVAAADQHEVAGEGDRGHHARCLAPGRPRGEGTPITGAGAGRARAPRGGRTPGPAAPSAPRRQSTGSPLGTVPGRRREIPGADLPVSAWRNATRSATCPSSRSFGAMSSADAWRAISRASARIA